MKCKLGYLVVAWDLCPCNWLEKLIWKCSVGYLVVGCSYALVIGGIK